MENNFIRLDLSPELSDESAILEEKEGKEKIPPQVKQYLLQEIDKLLNNYSNEIPTEIVHSTSIQEGGKDYKVRAAWFSIIEMVLRGIGKKYLPKELSDEALQLLVDVKMIDVQNKEIEAHPNASGVHITTKEEINRADNLLKRARTLIEEQ